MASVANHQIETGQCVLVFHELPSGQHAHCAVCKAGQAAYSWTKQGKEDLLPGPDQIVCRVCAGMILLVGTAY